MGIATTRFETSARDNVRYVPNPLRQQYDNIFNAERRERYPQIRKLEIELGYEVNLDKLESAARVLACPLKKNPPNWQHGRVVYATVADRIARLGRCEDFRTLDIGTAKGFSALCAEWACNDVGDDENVRLGSWQVTSVDVIDPRSKIKRNTVLEIDGAITLYETLKPWPEAEGIRFVQSTGIDWLKKNFSRLHYAFIDGKHSYDAVHQELALIAERQEPGDVIVADDLQVDGVAQAWSGLKGYSRRIVQARPERSYGIGVKD
jgi:hypothetical protein